MKRLFITASKPLLLCLVLAVLLFSLASPFLGDHDCAGDHCVLCSLQAQWKVAVCVLLTLFALFGVMTAVKAVRRPTALVRGMTVDFFTPVYNKVKLSD